MSEEKKVENLSSEASIDELNKALEVIKAGAQTDVPKEATEAPKQAEPEQVEAKVETKTEEVTPEATEAAQPQEVVEQPKDQFGGDYTKLRKSYEEGRKWNTRMSQDVAELKRTIEDLRASTRQPDKPQATWDQWQQAYEQDPLGTTQALTQRIAEQQAMGTKQELSEIKSTLDAVLAKNSVDKYRSQYKDFTEHEEEMKSFLEELPSELTHNPAYYDKLLDFSYQAVKGKRAQSDLQKAREAGRQEVLAKTKAKTEAHVEGSGKTSPEEPVDYRGLDPQQHFDLLKAKGLVRDEF